ncbi:MAG: ATP-dependent helicase [Candidatus Omnitrophota bacterium]
MIELKDKLNPAQLEAVSVIDGPVLVIAGAGSGKTRVIEYRVLNLIRHNIAPSSILLLTFTREASRRMLSRATQHDSRCELVDGGTFHSFAYKTLKKYSRAMGMAESFSVIDENDAGEAIQRCAASMGLFDKEKRFPKKDTLRAILSGCINRNLQVAAILEKEYPDFIVYAPEIEQLGKKYAAYKLERNLFDYDDLLIYLKLLLENPRIRQRISARYRYVMVDEYQDTNKLQADIACLLAHGHNNIMVVGDDAQSIYGFRGASHENIMGFPTRFKECKIIKLEENYRSSQSILDLANSVLENMRNKYSKCLVSARKSSGDKPEMLFFNNAYNEAEWIASKIKELRDEGVHLCEQAVLFRSAYISIPLQAELSKRNIPYRVFGGLKFYETAHVKDLLAHLRVISNPKDELSWLRILMLIPGIGPKTADKVMGGISINARLGDILDKSFSAYDKNKFGAGLGKLESALKSASAKDIGVGERFGAALDYYIPLLKEKFDDWSLRLNDLETLRQIACRYDSLEQLLADFTIESPEAGVSRVDPGVPEDERPLTLSTIHSAKGLEWDCVFVLGLAEGVLPVSFALDDESEIEEEHRLFYVAVTRPRNNLFLSLHHEASRPGISQFNRICRFIDSPNIMARLNNQAIFEPDIDDDEIEEWAGAGRSLYSKKSLLERASGYF